MEIGGSDTRGGKKTGVDIPGRGAHDLHPAHHLRAEMQIGAVGLISGAVVVRSDREGRGGGSYWGWIYR